MQEQIDEKINMEYIQKERHGCVSPFLILMFLINMTIPFLYILAKLFHNPNQETPLSIQSFLLGVFVIINLVSAFMLLKWKKLGYYGFVFSSIGIFLMVSLLGIKQIVVFIAVIGGLLLYGILHLKTKKGHSTWDSLE